MWCMLSGACKLEPHLIGVLLAGFNYVYSLDLQLTYSCPDAYAYIQSQRLICLRNTSIADLSIANPAIANPGTRPSASLRKLYRTVIAPALPDPDLARA